MFAALSTIMKADMEQYVDVILPLMIVSITSDEGVSVRLILLLLTLLQNVCGV